MQRSIYSRLKVGFISASIIIVGSCVSHDLDEAQNACVNNVSYSSDVRPIVLAKCAIEGCHNGDNGSDINWTEFDNFHSHSATVKNYVVDRVMPPASSPAGPLTQDQINTIACWVDQGAQNN